MAVPKSAYLFTLDVDSLYTNINTQLGLQTLKRILQITQTTKDRTRNCYHS